MWRKSSARYFLYLYVAFLPFPAHFAAVSCCSFRRMCRIFVLKALFHRSFASFQISFFKIARIRPVCNRLKFFPEFYMPTLFLPEDPVFRSSIPTVFPVRFHSFFIIFLYDKSCKRNNFFITFRYWLECSNVRRKHIKSKEKNKSFMLKPWVKNRR